MELFFDTETSDKFDFKTQSYKDENFPWVVQIGAILANKGIVLGELNFIIHPDGRKISDNAVAVHNIPAELAKKSGIPERILADIFAVMMHISDTLIAHNFDFDSRTMAGVLYRQGLKGLAHSLAYDFPCFCTMKETTDLCKLPGPYGWKWPKLSELYMFLFNESLVGAHDAMYDIRATMRCYYELKKRNLI